MLHTKPRSSNELAGQVAVVTGAAQGIGLAIAEELHARGARLVLVDLNAAAGAAATEALRHPSMAAVDFIFADLGDPAAIDVLAAEVSAFATRVDILINNAGIEIDVPFGQIAPAEFDRVLAVNLRAPLLVSQALAPMFPAAGGAIVNISSVHASHAFLNAIPYACSKAGLVALTRNLALELAPRRIRVNAVCPGYIDTPMWDEWVKLSPAPEELAARTAALHPLGRRGVPGDVAAAAVYLASAEAAWVTGTHLVVDGGLTIQAHG